MLTLAENSRKFWSVNKSSYETLALISRLNELKDEMALASNNKSLSDCHMTESELKMAVKAIEKEIRIVRKALWACPAN